MRGFYVSLTLLMMAATASAQSTLYVGGGVIVDETVLDALGHEPNMATGLQRHITWPPYDPSAIYATPQANRAVTQQPLGLPQSGTLLDLSKLERKALPKKQPAKRKAKPAPAPVLATPAPDIAVEPMPTPPAPATPPVAAATSNVPPLPAAGITAAPAAASTATPTPPAIPQSSFDLADIFGDKTSAAPVAATPATPPAAVSAPVAPPAPAVTAPVAATPPSQNLDDVAKAAMAREEKPPVATTAKALPLPITPAPSPVAAPTKPAPVKAAAPLEALPVINVPEKRPTTPPRPMVKPLALPDSPPLPPAAPTKAAPAPLEGISERVLFRAGVSELPAGALARLQDLAETLRDQPSTYIELRAYASASGTLSDSRRMALSRALAVREYLMEQGIAASRMHVKAIGSDNSTPPDRVDIAPAS